MDYKPREFDAECCNILANFAEMVVRDAERFTELDGHRKRNEDLARENQQLIRAIDTSADGYILCNPHNSGWCAVTAAAGHGSGQSLITARRSG